jgi:holo-[acyl-carrier protein] synthase
MNVHSIGVDLCEIGRIERILEQYGERFLTKIFTADEITYCAVKHYPAASFAARFAAKEAALKAFGTGLRGKFRWKDIEVNNDALGKPEFKFYGETARVVKERTVFLSLSHTGEYAIAFVVIV